MVSFENLKKLARTLRIAFLVLMAVMVCYRGSTFNDTHGTGVVPVTMCLGTAVLLGLLAFALAAKNSSEQSS
jgi:hypothetical protein